jgi:hypothetical protein
LPNPPLSPGAERQNRACATLPGGWSSPGRGLFHAESAEFSGARPQKTAEKFDVQFGAKGPEFAGPEAPRNSALAVGFSASKLELPRGIFDAKNRLRISELRNLLTDRKISTKAGSENLATMSLSRENNPNI